jgi:hypothetical protein
MRGRNGAANLDHEEEDITLLLRMAFAQAEERCELRGGDIEELKRLENEPPSRELLQKVEALFKPKVFGIF